MLGIWLLPFARSARSRLSERRNRGPLGRGPKGAVLKLAAELVALNVAAIVGSIDAALAAKAVTTSIPIVFVTGSHPVTEGLVSSVNRPGGNITGVSFYDVPTIGKRLQLLRQLVPKAEIIAVLQDPNYTVLEAETHELEAAASAMKQKIIIVKASREQDIDTAFSAIARSGAGALLIGAGGFLTSRRHQLVELAALHAIPACFPFSEAVAAGGLFSYGASQTDAYRRAGHYVGRILKGEKPSDLPVEFPTKFVLRQSQDRQDAWPHRANFAGRWRRPGGSVTNKRSASRCPFLACAVKGGAFQRVQIPPGNRSSRKQPEQLWR